MIAQALAPVEISGLRPADFRASLWQSGFGPFKLSVVRETSAEVRRTRAGIAQGSTGEFYLIHARSGGGMLLEQGGRSHVVRPNDCALVHADAPYRIVGGEQEGEILVMTVRGDHLRRWIPDPAALAGTALSGTSGWGAALSAALANLDEDWPETLSLPPAIVGDQLLALLALAVGRDAGTFPRQGLLFRRIKETIQERCHEHELDPAMVAAEQRISKRHLHNVLAMSGCSFGQMLIESRLDRAQHVLDDARFRWLTIGEVAARSGFADASHFTKRFRQRFGVTPTAYRRS
jgi:AraC-like DNA-binding protein